MRRGGESNRPSPSLRRRPPHHRRGRAAQSDTPCRRTDGALRVHLLQRGHPLVRAARTRPRGGDRSPDGESRWGVTPRWRRSEFRLAHSANSREPQGSARRSFLAPSRWCSADGWTDGHNQVGMGLPARREARPRREGHAGAPHPHLRIGNSIAMLGPMPGAQAEAIVWCRPGRGRGCPGPVPVFRDRFRRPVGRSGFVRSGRARRVSRGGWRSRWWG